MTGIHSSDSVLIFALMYLAMQDSTNSTHSTDFACIPLTNSDTYASIRLSVVSDNGSAVFTTWEGSCVSGSDCRDYSAELEALLDKAERTEALSSALLSSFRSTALGMLAGAVWLILFILFQTLTTS